MARWTATDWFGAGLSDRRRSGARRRTAGGARPAGAGVVRRVVLLRLGLLGLLLGLGGFLLQLGLRGGLLGLLGRGRLLPGDPLERVVPASGQPDRDVLRLGELLDQLLLLHGDLVGGDAGGGRGLSGGDSELLGLLRQRLLLLLGLGGALGEGLRTGRGDLEPLVARLHRVAGALHDAVAVHQAVGALVGDQRAGGGQLGAVLVALGDQVDDAVPLAGDGEGGLPGLRLGVPERLLRDLEAPPRTVGALEGELGRGGGLLHAGVRCRQRRLDLADALLLARDLGPGLVDLRLGRGRRGLVRSGQCGTADREGESQGRCGREGHARDGSHRIYPFRRGSRAASPRHETIQTLGLTGHS